MATARWNAFCEESRETLRQTAEESGGRDPAGLLTLANWLASYVSEFADEDVVEIALALGMEIEQVESDGIRVALEEALYDALWDMLRALGWLQPAPDDGSLAP